LTATTLPYQRETRSTTSGAEGTEAAPGGGAGATAGLGASDGSAVTS
jgi:hypothetical protein